MAEIETFGIEIDEKEARERLGEIARWPGVEKIVALPDIHQKKHLEAPTSIAVSTRDIIIPALTTPTLGCSMGMITTDLTREQIDEKFLKTFFAHIKEHLTFSPPSRLRTLMQWLGLMRPNSGSYDFSRLELEQVAKFGARAVLEKYNFPESILNNFENPGKKLESLDNLIPRSGYQFSRSNIGYGFHGNHFLELQYVDEIVDQDVASKWGLKKDQVIVSYHGGEGALAFFIGRYFSNSRKKYSRREELMRLPAKLLFHFNLKSLKHYFSKKLLAIPSSSKEGKRYMSAIQAGVNYGGAFRLAMVRRIIDALGVRANLLWDTSHTTITQENFAGKNLVVHRNGAVKIISGKPVLISGSDKVRSYLGVGLSDANSSKYLNSVDHGAGETIKRLGPTGHDYIVKILENANLVRPVAYIKPIATFRD